MGWMSFKVSQHLTSLKQIALPSWSQSIKSRLTALPPSFFCCFPENQQGKTLRLGTRKSPRDTRSDALSRFAPFSLALEGYILQRAHPLLLTEFFDMRNPGKPLYPFSPLMMRYELSTDALIFS
jgi:hypothetical protein